MTANELRALLRRGGLRQADVGRLVRLVTGEAGPDGHQIGRYCRGVRPVPRMLAAFLRLFMQLPLRHRERMLARARGDAPWGTT